LELLGEFLGAVWFILPAYFASISPVWFRLRGKTPLDFGRTFRGKPIFGSSKTLKGFIGGALCGTLLGGIQQFAFGKPYGFLLGALLGFGAMTGDAIKSFFKRQHGIPPGKSWFPFDQLDFIVGALIFAAAVATPTLIGLVIIIVLTPPLHLLSNIADCKVGLKEVPN
jgi:CDP-2,3-bis-(O-geranylgeranyl)-sn-glycerol synthase